MKKTILLLLLFLTFVIKSQSQKNDNFPISIGPYIDYTMSINGVDTPEGRKNGIAFPGLPNLGLSGYYPLSETARLGIRLDLGLNNYSYFIESDPGGDKYLHNYSYVTLAPQYYFHGFIGGFRFGLPVFADMEDNEIPTEDMNYMVEVILGGTFQIYGDETGSINAYFRLGYMLSGIYDDFKADEPLRGIIAEIPNEPIDNSFNPRAGSLSIGFSYNFYLTK